MHYDNVLLDHCLSYTFSYPNFCVCFVHSCKCDTALVKRSFHLKYYINIHFERNIVNIFLSTSFNIVLAGSKRRSHFNCSVPTAYGLAENKKNNILSIKHA